MIRASPHLQLALRETPRHKVRRVSKLRERINTLQKEVTQLQVGSSILACWVCIACSRAVCMAAEGIL